MPAEHDGLGNQLLSDNNAVPFTSTENPFNNSEDPYGSQVVDPELVKPGISGPASLYETPLPIIWGPFAGSYIFGAGHFRRPGIVYWTNDGSPDTAGFLNEVQVSPSSKPVIAGFVFGGNSFVFTRDDLYALDWGGPTSEIEFTPRAIPIGQGLSAPKGFCVSPSGVFFIYKDGIYQTDCNSESICVTKDSLKPIFLGRSSSEFLPIDWSKAYDIVLESASES